MGRKRKVAKKKAAAPEKKTKTQKWVEGAEKELPEAPKPPPEAPKEPEKPETLPPEVIKRVVELADSQEAEKKRIEDQRKPRVLVRGDIIYDAQVCPECAAEDVAFTSSTVEVQNPRGDGNELWGKFRCLTCGCLWAAVPKEENDGK